MELTKFHELCNAYGLAQDNFEAYRVDCHLIAIEIVKELKAYYQVPDSQFSLYKINSNNEFVLVKPELIQAITLREDHFWHFGIGLTVCKAPEALPEELILIHLLFRKDAHGKYFIRHAYNNVEFEIVKNNSESYVPFLDALFKTTIASYNNQLQQFIGEKTERKLGYVK